MGVYEVLPSGALSLYLAFFTSFIKFFYINMCYDGFKRFHFSVFYKKVRIHNLTDSPIFHTFFFFFSFLMKFHTFLTTHNFEKSLYSKNFLSTILQMIPLFFQRRPFFWRNCLMQSFYVQLSLLPFPFPYLFLPSFLFISLITKHNISFEIQLIKKRCFEDINKKSMNLVRMRCKIYVLHHPIRDVTSVFFLKLSTSYHN